MVRVSQLSTHKQHFILNENIPRFLLSMKSPLFVEVTSRDEKNVQMYRKGESQYGFPPSPPKKSFLTQKLFVFHA